MLIYIKYISESISHLIISQSYRIKLGLNQYSKMILKSIINLLKDHLLYYQHTKSKNVEHEKEY